MPRLGAVVQAEAGIPGIDCWKARRGAPLATTIYLQITGAYDKVGTAAMAVVLLAITLLMFAAQKYYLEAKTVATLTGKASRGRMLIGERSVTLPLIKDSFLSGLVTAFVRSITAISAIILLVTPQFLLITVQINEFAEKGSYSLACAFATILIIITYGSVLLMNLVMKFFGTSRKLKEDE